MAQGLTLEQLQKLGATPVQRVGGGFTLDQLQAQNSQPQVKPAFQSPLNAGLSTLGNVPKSAVGFAKSSVDFLNPVNTAKTIGQLGTAIPQARKEGVTLGAVAKEVPKELYKALIPQFFQALFSGNTVEAQRIITEDPVGQLAPVLLASRGLAQKAGVAKQFDAVMKKTTQVATKPITVPLKAAGNVAVNTLGVTTGAGGEAVRTALGGGKDFTDAMRGKTSMQDVLQESQDAFSRLAQKRSSEYQSQLANIKLDTKNLDISPVFKTLDDNLKSFNVKPINGEITPQSFSRSTLQNDTGAQAIFKTVYDNLKTYGTQPGDRTPIALDTLKRSLGDLYSDNSSVRSFAQSMTDSVKTILKKDVKGYEEMSKGYSDISNLMKDVKQNLAVGGKAAEATAMTRITNALKQNNELRLEVLKELEKTTGVNLRDKIAGASLSDKIPRGLIGKGIDIYALSSLFSGVINPSALAQILITSPRFVGELMNGLGVGGRATWKVIKPLNESPMIMFDPKKRAEIDAKLKRTPLGMSIQDVSTVSQPTQTANIIAKKNPISTRLGQKSEVVNKNIDSKTGLPMDNSGQIKLDATTKPTAYFEMKRQEAAKTNGFAKYWPDQYKQDAMKKYAEDANLRRILRTENTGKPLDAKKASGSYKQAEQVVQGGGNTLENPKFAPIKEATPEANLTPEYKAIETSAFEKLKSNPQGAVDAYRALPETKNGKVVNTDTARKIFNDVGYNGINAAAVQEPSSALAKVMYKEGLKNKGDAVVYAGGSGTGKSSAVKGLLSSLLDSAAVINDGNLSNIKSARKLVKQATDAGKEANVVYVYRDAVESFVDGVVKRMLTNKSEGGRVVPSSVVAKNHIDSYNVVRELSNDYLSGGMAGKMRFHLVDNSLGFGNQKLMGLDKFYEIKYPSVSELHQQLIKETKKLYEQGTINKAQYEALIK